MMEYFVCDLYKLFKFFCDSNICQLAKIALVIMNLMCSRELIVFDSGKYCAKYIVQLIFYITIRLVDFIIISKEG